MNEAARDQRIPYNPVWLWQEPHAEAYRTAISRLGQLQRYLDAAEQLSALPLIYTELSSGLRQCELITLSWADFHVRCRNILKGQRLLTLNSKVKHLLERIQETGSYVFLNPRPEHRINSTSSTTCTSGYSDRLVAEGGLPEPAATVHGGGDMTLRDYVLR